MEEPANQPLVSVVIPTYNSQKNIEQCLNSIKKQTYGNVEILVVDRHSTDDTVQMSRRFKAKVLPLDAERSEAKNFAAAKANGSFLLFIDSDMVLSQNVVKNCVDRCLQQDVDAITIPEKCVGQGLIGEWRKAEKNSLSTSEKFVEIPRFFKKSAFLAVGGYDEQLVCGEDFDFFQRFKNRSFKTDKIFSNILHFEGNPSLRSILSKAYYYGRTFPALIKKNPLVSLERYAGMRLVFMGNLGASFRGIGSLLGFFTVKMLEYGAYFLGIFSQLVCGVPEKLRFKKLGSKVLENKTVLISFTLILAVAIIIFRNFLFTNEWPGGGDVMGFVSRTYLYSGDLKWLYMWRPYSFGFIEGINFMDFFMMLFYMVFRDSSWTTKIFMFLSYLAAGSFMYLFAYRHTRHNVASLSASLVYILNQWLFSQLTEAHADIIYSYALAPLIFMLADKALQTGKPKETLFFCIGLSLFATSFHPECIVIYGFFLIIFAVFFVFFPAKTGTLKTRFLRLLKVSLPSALIVFLFSAFFLVPFFMNVRSPYVHPSYEYPLEDAVSSSYQNLTDAFTLRAVEKWGYNNVVDVYSGLGLPDFPVYTLLLVIFAVSYSVLLFRRDRYTVFFAISMLISVFIAKGPQPPFGQIFVWAWFNIPHFAIFRAANRWVMMAIFSHAFFVSLLVTYLTKYVKNRKHVQGNAKYFKVKVKGNGLSKIRNFIVSIDASDSFFKEIHRILYFFSIILLIFTLLSGFFSCFYFFSQGLQVYTPPKTYLSPYEWLASQNDDYKVVSVNRGPSEWLTASDQSSDFAFSAMQTTLGWSHDIGFDSSFIHDKPVLQDGGWDFKTRQFVDHLRFKLVREHLTDNLLKMLGPFAYKYVVIPSYATNDTREFLLNQTGYQIIYNQTAMILQNEYAAPEIFATNSSIIVVGGLESFNSLCKIDNFNPNKTSMFFASAPLEENVASLEMFNKAQTLSFVDSDVLDLAMMSLDKDVDIVYAGDYGASSINATRYWVKMPSWRRLGSFVLSGDTLTTSGKNQISISFELDSEGAYDVWLRVGLASYRGKLSITVDGEPVQEIHPETPLWSKLAWINVTQLNLAKGKHLITLENDGTGYNDVDAIAIVKPSHLESKINETITILQSFPGRFMYLLEAENVFLEPSSSSWSWITKPMVGSMIRLENLGLNVAPLALSNASSSSDCLEANYANDGDMSTRWASEKDLLPQWLEVSWSQKQRIRGAKIMFENAYATNYTIQTWNGTDWINQTSVTGNNALEKTHTFNETVETSKVRVYITAFSLFDRVSIWELKVFSTETTSAPAKITIPRKGYYVLAARVATGPDYGTAYFRINDDICYLPCNDSLNKVGWRWTTPFNFDVGEQTVSVGGIGLVELDEILVYSLNDGETALSLPELFNSSSCEASAQYEKVDPCTYQVNVSTDTPFTLIFSETYSPFWKAIINGEEIPSTLAYSMVNSFYINRTGRFTVIIYFTGQTYANTGLIISFVSFVSISVATPVLSIVLRRRRLLKPKS